MAIKASRGGKYSKINSGFGYYGNNTAGQPHKLIENTAGVKREFIGSGTKEYTFYSDTKGMLTVRADSYQDAWKQAKNRGYSRRLRKG